MARELIAEAQASLGEFGSKAEPLHEIAAYFLTRRK